MAENDFSINDALTMRPGGLGALGRIDQYELVRELGGGGFGTVYLARVTVSGVEYAVKGLPPTVRDVPEELENIRANFALVSRLSHTHIARAHVLHLAKDVFYADELARRKLRVESGDTLMVMEYAPGVTLSKWRRQFPGGKVPAEKAAVIVRQVAAALDYAHRQRILHRDVKPANVMVETLEDGSLVARVLDFGLAAEIRSSMGHVSREIHDTSGTRPYMAPEQWVGAKQGPATDQYALAALFCELVTGEVPFASVFETNDPMVMLNAVRGEPYVPPPDLPKAMRAALVRALAKKPGKRFASCTAFANALGGAGPRWQGPVFSVLALLVLGAAVYWLCGLDFGAGRRNKAQRLKDAAVELRERARLAHEDAERRGFASDEALARLYREFERCYRAGMESYDNGNYVSATNFFERAGEGMRQLAAEKRRLDAVRESAEAQDRKAKEEKGRLTRQFIEACKDERYVDAARVVDSIDRGDAEVQFFIGKMYENGQGVVKDETEAVKWYRKAAEQGHAEAQMKLGICYYKGRGVEKDLDAYVKWFRKSAEQGYEVAQFNLGVIYDTGKGVEKDEAEAVNWYRKAAEQNHAIAQINLGEMYENGSGVTRDYAEAVKWYRKAAEQGNASGEFNLGVMYEYGKGVEKDKAEAIKWYRKAAEQGHDSAKKRLASLTSAQVPNTDEKDASRSAIRAEGAAQDLAENSLRRALASSSIQIGCDHERGRIVVIGTESFSLKDKTSIDERNTYEYQEVYDFPDDPNDDFEMKRFKAMWKAYANAIAESIEEYGRIMTEETNTISLVAELTDVRTLKTVELSTGDEYGIAVAVTARAKREESFSRSSLGEISRPGPLSISEFIQEGTYEDIVPRVYVDNHGNLWRVASVPIDLSVTRGAGIVKKNAIAKQYAFEAALRTLSVRVTSTQSILDNHENVYSVRVDPLETVSSKEDSRVKWFALDRVNPLTSNSVRVIVCAIRSDAVSRVASSVEKNDAGSVQTVRAVPSTKTGQKLKTGDTKTISLPGGATMEMIYVAPGTFKMGSPAYERGRHDDEIRREVSIPKGFWLGKYEVTQKQWRSVMEDNPSHFVGDDLPVENVSWDDCQQFIKRVNAQLHCGARLPTETEWECACRAGTTTAYFWGDKLNGDKANCDGNWPYGTTETGPFLQKTAPVGSYAANPWGFYDMHGNVYEWCEDWYDGEERVLRGSGWYDGAQGCRSSCRYKSLPRYRSSSFGFRLACSQVPDEESRPTPVAQNEIDGQSLESYCNTFKVKDGDTPVVVSTAWGVNPRRLIHAEDLKSIEDYRDTKEIVSRMLAENNIQEWHNVERGRIVKIGTWGFSMGGGASDVDETNYEIDCGFPDSVDDDFEMKRFKAMWKAYAQALAEIVRYQGENIESSVTETNSATKGSAMSIKSRNSEINAMASMRLAGVTFLAMAESWAEGRYEVSVAMCQSAKRKESYSSRSTGIGSCRGRYSIFEWLERVSKIGIICPQAYCDKDGVWWRIAGVPFRLDGKRFKMKDSTVEAKRYAYEAAVRTIEVQVASESRLTSVTTEKSGGEIRVDHRSKEHVKIDPVVAIPPLSITTMEMIDPLTGKSIRLAVAFLSENDARALERAGDGSSR